MEDEKERRFPQSKGIRMIAGSGYLSVLCCLLILVLSCHSDPSHAPKEAMHKAVAREQEGAYNGEGFRLMIPDGIRVAKVEPIDYILYTFIEEDREILRAYVGNHPSLAYEDQRRGPETVEELNGLRCRRVQVQRDDGHLWMEVLVRLPRTYGWPAYVHFWYRSRESRDMAAAESIIASITPQADGAQLSSFPDAGGPDFPPVSKSTEATIAEMERTLEEMKKQQGMTEEVKEYEAWLALRKDVYRGAQEAHRKALERTPEETRIYELQLLEENIRDCEFIIADMEEYFEEIKAQGMTKEVEQCETMINSLKEELRLKREEFQSLSEGRQKKQ